jgi:hypothetical protein
LRRRSVAMEHGDGFDKNEQMVCFAKTLINDTTIAAVITRGKEAFIRNYQDVCGAEDFANLISRVKLIIKQEKSRTRKRPEIDYSSRSEKVKERVDKFAVNVGQIMKSFEDKYGHVLNDKAMARLLNKNEVETAQKNGSKWHDSSVRRVRKRLVAIQRENKSKGPT